MLTGQLQIARQVLTKYIEAVLAYDQRNGDFRVIGLEKEHLAHLSIETEDGPKEVALAGVIDRLDIKDSKVRLLDYKQGRIPKNSFDCFPYLIGTIRKETRPPCKLFFTPFSTSTKIQKTSSH